MSLSKEQVVQIYILKGQGVSWEKIATDLKIGYHLIRYPSTRPERDFVYFFSSQARSTDDTMNFLGVDSKKDLQEKLKKLAADGIRVNSNPFGKYYMRPIMGPSFDYDDRNYYSQEVITDSKYIGIVSDTHFGNKASRQKELKDFYRIAHDDYGVDIILHLGDWTEGNGKVYRGQAHDMELFGFDKLVQNVVNDYPFIPDVTTYGISGNHDMSFFNSEGAHALKVICRDREDVKFLGDYHATICINGIKFYLIHPSGGRAETLSYRPQKLLRNLETELIPDVFLIGHYHTFVEFNVRNTLVMQLSSFCGHTNLSRRNGWENHVGGLILDLESLNTEEVPRQINKIELVYV